MNSGSVCFVVPIEITYPYLVPGANSAISGSKSRFILCMFDGMNDYDRIARAIEYICEHADRQPSLAEMAAAIHLSPYHFQRLFSRWAGISPKRFLQTQTLGHARRLLDRSASLAEASQACGLSGSGRLYDHFVALEAVTPGEYRLKGHGLDIHYGLHDTPFGRALIAVTPRGICRLAFFDDKPDKLIKQLGRDWPLAGIKREDNKTRALIDQLFKTGKPADKPLSLFVKGTNFQVNVWRALLGIEPGRLLSYQQLAQLINRPTAARAVGNAVGANPVAFIIPCHRVINASGVIGNYRWGPTRKRAMIVRETSREIDPNE